MPRKVIKRNITEGIEVPSSSVRKKAKNKIERGDLVSLDSDGRIKKYQPELSVTDDGNKNESQGIRFLHHDDIEIVPAGWSATTNLPNPYLYEQIKYYSNLYKEATESRASIQIGAIATFEATESGYDENELDEFYIELDKSNILHNDKLATVYNSSKKASVSAKHDGKSFCLFIEWYSGSNDGSVSKTLICPIIEFNYINDFSLVAEPDSNRVWLFWIQRYMFDPEMMTYAGTWNRTTEWDNYFQDTTIADYDITRNHGFHYVVFDLDHVDLYDTAIQATSHDNGLNNVFKYDQPILRSDIFPTSFVIRGSTEYIGRDGFKFFWPVLGQKSLSTYYIDDWENDIYVRDHELIYKYENVVSASDLRKYTNPPSSLSYEINSAHIHAEFIINDDNSHDVVVGMMKNGSYQLARFGLKTIDLINQFGPWPPQNEKVWTQRLLAENADPNTTSFRSTAYDGTNDSKTIITNDYHSRAFDFIKMDNGKFLTACVSSNGEIALSYAYSWNGLTPSSTFFSFTDPEYQNATLSTSFNSIFLNGIANEENSLRIFKIDNSNFNIIFKINSDVDKLKLARLSIDASTNQITLTSIEDISDSLNGLSKFFIKDIYYIPSTNFGLIIVNDDLNEQKTFLFYRGNTTIKSVSFIVSHDSVSNPIIFKPSFLENNSFLIKGIKADDWQNLTEYGVQPKINDYGNLIGTGTTYWIDAQDYYSSLENNQDLKVMLPRDQFPLGFYYDDSYQNNPANGMGLDIMNSSLGDGAGLILYARHFAFVKFPNGTVIRRGADITNQVPGWENGTPTGGAKPRKVYEIFIKQPPRMTTDLVGAVSSYAETEVYGIAETSGYEGNVIDVIPVSNIEDSTIWSEKSEGDYFYSSNGIVASESTGNEQVDFLDRTFGSLGTLAAQKFYSLSELTALENSVFTSDEELSVGDVVSLSSQGKLLKYLDTNKTSVDAHYSNLFEYVEYITKDITSNGFTYTGSKVPDSSSLAFKDNGFNIVTCEVPNINSSIYGSQGSKRFPVKNNFTFFIQDRITSEDGSAVSNQHSGLDVCPIQTVFNNQSKEYSLYKGVYDVRPISAHSKNIFDTSITMQNFTENESLDVISAKDAGVEYSRLFEIDKFDTTNYSMLPTSSEAQSNRVVLTEIGSFIVYSVEEYTSTSSIDYSTFDDYKGFCPNGLALPAIFTIEYDHLDENLYLVGYPADVGNLERNESYSNKLEIKLNVSSQTSIVDNGMLTLPTLQDLDVRSNNGFAVRKIKPQIIKIPFIEQEIEKNGSIGSFNHTSILTSLSVSEYVNSSDSNYRYKPFNPDALTNSIERGRHDLLVLFEVNGLKDNTYNVRVAIPGRIDLGDSGIAFSYIHVTKGTDWQTNYGNSTHKIHSSFQRAKNPLNYDFVNVPVGSEIIIPRTANKFDNSLTNSVVGTVSRNGTAFILFKRENEPWRMKKIYGVHTPPFQYYGKASDLYIDNDGSPYTYTGADFGFYEKSNELRITNNDDPAGSYTVAPNSDYPNGFPATELIIDEDTVKLTHNGLGAAGIFMDENSGDILIISSSEYGESITLDRIRDNCSTLTVDLGYSNYMGRNITNNGPFGKEYSDKSHSLVNHIELFSKTRRQQIGENTQYLNEDKVKEFQYEYSPTSGLHYFMWYTSTTQAYEYNDEGTLLLGWSTRRHMNVCVLDIKNDEAGTMEIVNSWRHSISGTNDHEYMRYNQYYQNYYLTSGAAFKNSCKLFIDGATQAPAILNNNGWNPQYDLETNSFIPSYNFETNSYNYSYRAENDSVLQLMLFQESDSHNNSPKGIVKSVSSSGNYSLYSNGEILEFPNNYNYGEIVYKNYSTGLISNQPSPKSFVIGRIISNSEIEIDFEAKPNTKSFNRFESTENYAFGKEKSWILTYEDQKNYVTYSTMSNFEQNTNNMISEETPRFFLTNKTTEGMFTENFVPYSGTKFKNSYSKGRSFPINDLIFQPNHHIKSGMIIEKINYRQNREYNQYDNYHVYKDSYIINVFKDYKLIYRNLFNDKFLDNKFYHAKDSQGKDLTFPYNTLSFMYYEAENYGGLYEDAYNQSYPGGRLSELANAGLSRIPGYADLSRPLSIFLERLISDGLQINEDTFIKPAFQINDLPSLIEDIYDENSHTFIDHELLNVRSVFDLPRTPNVEQVQSTGRWYGSLFAGEMYTSSFFFMSYIEYKKEKPSINIPNVLTKDNLHDMPIQNGTFLHSFNSSSQHLFLSRTNALKENYSLQWVQGAYAEPVNNFRFTLAWPTSPYYILDTRYYIDKSQTDAAKGDTPRFLYQSSGALTIPIAYSNVLQIHSHSVYERNKNRKDPYMNMGLEKFLNRLATIETEDISDYYLNNFFDEDDTSFSSFEKKNYLPIYFSAELAPQSDGGGGGTSTGGSSSMAAIFENTYPLIKDLKKTKFGNLDFANVSFMYLEIVAGGSHTIDWNHSSSPLDTRYMSLYPGKLNIRWGNSGTPTLHSTGSDVFLLMSQDKGMSWDAYKLFTKTSPPVINDAFMITGESTDEELILPERYESWNTDKSGHLLRVQSSQKKYTM